MIYKKDFILSLLVVFCLLAASCGQASREGDLLGDELINQEGGFSLRKPFGYTMQMDGNIVNFIAPDALPEIGPMLMAMGGSTTESRWTMIHSSTRLLPVYRLWNSPVPRNSPSMASKGC